MPTKLKPHGDPMTESEFSALVAFLLASGAKNKDLRAALGGQAQGRPRSQVSAELRAWLKKRPKGAPNQA